MLEVMQYLRTNGYRTFIVTGGGQEFVRAYAERVYGIPPEQVVGSTADVTFGYEKTGKSVRPRFRRGCGSMTRRASP